MTYEPVPPAAEPFSSAPDVSAPYVVDNAAEVVLSEERVRVDTRWVPTAVVRVSKRIVTEEVTRTVQVRREELDIERTPYTGDLGLQATPQAAREPIEIVLHSEEVEFVPRVVAREIARVYVDRMTEHEVVHTDLAREQVEIEHNVTADVLDTGGSATR